MVLFCCFDCSPAREKVALLIGNQHYDCEEMNDLRSPENDIRQLCSLLENELNFKVISLLDLTHSEMMHALERFYEMLAVSGVYALFYYSGHGFTTSVGKNYLIPVDASPSLSCDQNIHVDMICGQMRRKLSRAVVVLDCCRVKSRCIHFLRFLLIMSFVIVLIGWCTCYYF